MKLLVILTTCAVCLDLITAKSNTSINQEVKLKGSPKLNSISTTPKPDSDFQPLQQLQQDYRQQLQQNYPRQPAPPRYQILGQSQRQIHDQQIVLQPIPAHQPQGSTAQQQLQQQQLSQANYQPQLQSQVQPQLQHQLQPQLQSQLQHQLSTQLQNQLHPQLQHVIQKAYIVPPQHNRPAAMILIAHPAYVPQNVVYGNTAGPQLVNYIPSGPQARYQFLHGNPQPQAQVQLQPQQIYQQTPAHSIGNYQVVVPARYQQNLVAVPQASHVQTSALQHPSSTSPLQLAQIAQIASQQYSRINPEQHQQQPQASAQPVTYQTEGRSLQENVQTSGQSIPPIITGFEHFTPEQQEKIKVQLSAYFGGPLKPLPNTRVPGDVGQEGQAQGSQVAQKYQTEGSRFSSDFVPSEQVKEDASASSSNVFKSHYARV